MTAAEYALAAGISIQEARRRAPSIPGARKVKPDGRVSPAVWEIPDSAISEYVPRDNEISPSLIPIPPEKTIKLSGKMISIPIEGDPVKIEDPAKDDDDELEDLLEGIGDKKKTAMIGILIGTVVALVGMITSIPNESRSRLAKDPSRDLR